MINRKYKSTMFTMIFSDKKELLQLYNAIAEKNYDDPELLTINTLKNAIYMSIQNDLSFIIDSRLSLYEHQSTYNSNLPLRYLFYISDLYQVMVKDRNIYGTKRIQVPAPRFIVFYNGEEKQPERQILKLSELYLVEEQHPVLELEAIMLNINQGYNQTLMNSCKTLRDYSEYVSRVRKYAKILDIEEAVDRAIMECIDEGILKDFLERNRLEAKAVSIYEYDQEAHIKMEREDAFEDGRQEGNLEGQNRIIKLIHYMTEAGELEQIPRLSTDKEFFEEMVRKYNIV